MIDKLPSDTPILHVPETTVLDFWAWAYSDILSNCNRAVFAEFLVGTALGVIDSARIEWDASDLTYRDKPIEVKASAYIQSWPQDKLSRITFDISKKRAWHAETNQYDSEPSRVADCYVFCLFGAKHIDAANPLDANLWEFYVVSRGKLEAAFGDQKSIGLNRLTDVSERTNYAGIRIGVDEALDV